MAMITGWARICSPWKLNSRTRVAGRDANDSGRVVALGHSCGAHSEVRLDKRHEPIPLPDPVVDDIDDELERF